MKGNGDGSQAISVGIKVPVASRLNCHQVLLLSSVQFVRHCDCRPPQKLQDSMEGMDPAGIDRSGVTFSHANTSDTRLLCLRLRRAASAALPRVGDLK